MKTAVTCVLLLGLLGTVGAQDAGPKFTEAFVVEDADWSSTGTNPYFILEPGYTLVLEGKEDDKDTVLTVTVLDETKKIAGVETRVVEEKEVVGGQPVEISRNYFAISKKTASVYYFGEDVDHYKDGKVAGHAGSWHAGEQEAKFGLAMPGTPLLGARYCQEMAPGVAMDRAEILSVSEKFECAAGKFERCLKIEETTPLEKGEKEYKLYAPGVGQVTDGELKLVRCGRPAK